MTTIFYTTAPVRGDGASTSTVAPLAGELGGFQSGISIRKVLLPIDHIALQVDAWRQADPGCWCGGRQAFLDLVKAGGASCVLSEL